MRIAGLGCRCRRYFNICDNHHLHTYRDIRSRLILGSKCARVVKIDMNLYPWGRLCPQSKVFSYSRVRMKNFEG